MQLTVCSGPDLICKNIIFLLQAVTNQTVENKSKFEEKHFILSGSSVSIDAGLTNQSNEWVMTSQDSGEVNFSIQ